MLHSASNTSGMYVSTRGECPATDFMSAIRHGLAHDGGLYMRRTIPTMPVSQLMHFCTSPDLTYTDAAQTILEQLIDDSISPQTLYPMVQAAYARERWSGRSNICPLTSLLSSPAHHDDDEEDVEDREQTADRPPREAPSRKERHEDDSASDITNISAPKRRRMKEVSADAEAAARCVSPAEATLWVLELYHGPTAAFKDFALQLFPRCFHAAIESVQPDVAAHAEDRLTERGRLDMNTNRTCDETRTQDAVDAHTRRYTILAATSGDTGVAAISGFLHAGGGRVRVMILYPEHGVSAVQQLQMLTLDNGTDVRVYGVANHFDFCQRTVKQLFGDAALTGRLASARPPVQLSSANSINWGRLIPQVVYYFWAYRQYGQEAMRRQMGDTNETQKETTNSAAVLAGATSVWQWGDAIDVVVPCGNFGNILAGYVAKRMGLPLRRLVVASNENDVLTDFIATGRYDIRHRRLTATASPSIDILRASNVERLLYLLADGDSAEVRACMRALDTQSCFDLSPAMRREMGATFWAGRCSEAACAETIRRVFVASGRRRLLDPHTAVAVTVAQAYRAFTRESHEKASGHITSDAEHADDACHADVSRPCEKEEEDGVGVRTTKVRHGSDADHADADSTHCTSTNKSSNTNEANSVNTPEDRASWGIHSPQSECAVPLIVLSTAHWAKFPSSVLQAIRGQPMRPTAESTSPLETVHRVRACYDDILSAATPNTSEKQLQQQQQHGECSGEDERVCGHARVSVHPALQQAIQCAEERAREVRRVAANVSDIAAEVERFSTQ